MLRCEFQNYRDMLSDYYRQEQRWQDRPFWRQRHLRPPLTALGSFVVGDPQKSEPSLESATIGGGQLPLKRVGGPHECLSASFPTFPMPSKVM
jgi:hypothetical protein